MSKIYTQHHLLADLERLTVACTECRLKFGVRVGTTAATLTLKNLTKPLVARRASDLPHLELARELIRQARIGGISPNDEDPASRARIALVGATKPEHLALAAFATALKADLARRRSNLPAARELMETAWMMVEGLRLDHATRADLLSIQAAVWRDSNRLSEATDTFVEALDRYWRSDEQFGLWRTLLNYGELLRLRRQPEAALGTLRGLDEVIPYDEDPALSLAVKAQIAFCFVEAGTPSLAEAHLAKYSEHWDEAEQVLESPLKQWLEGRVASGLGHFDRAGQRLTSAFRDYCSRNEPFDAALVGLDLAICLVDARDQIGLRRLCDQLGDLEEIASRAHSNAQKAIRHLRHSLEQGTFSPALWLRLSRFFELARRNPELTAGD